MQGSENYASAELGTTFQQAMENASPPMPIDDPPTSTETSVRPRIHTTTIAKTTADVDVNEDASKPRTVDAAQLQKGIETELHAIADFEVKEDVDVTPLDFTSKSGHHSNAMGSHSEDSSTRTLQTCRQGLQGAHSGLGLGFRSHSSVLFAPDPSG
eukprot:859369-Alexandrium_andersonii.AAC.1